MKPVTLGVIVGNRGFFPDHLCKAGRETILRILEEEGIQVVALDEQATKFGSIFTLEDLTKMRRPVPQAPRRDRWSAGDPAQLWRRERHRQRAALV